jgi:hypothetical protein
VVLEDLPSYAPALNPDEMVWAWLKYGEHLLTELEWATFDRELLAGFFNHAHLGVQL